MFLIQNTLVSLDVLEKEFCCDLETCRGCCCVEGDAGAPVSEEEVTQIEALLPELLPHMSKEAREVVAQQGISYLDPSGEQVLSIVNDKDCIFARTDHKGWTYCLIEKLKIKNYELGESDKPQILKPISCHLYPIRLTKVGDLTGVEYHRWDICHCGRQLGKKLHLPLYKFLREPLIRRFGEAWYAELELTASEWKKQCAQK